MWKSMAAAAMLVVMHGAAFAQATPAGLWKTLDDAGKVEQSLVRIVDHGGMLDGTIEAVLDPATPAGQRCDRCQDDRKGRPLVGLEIIRHARHDADDPSTWTGGEVLDPANGTTYRLRLRPIDGGRRLEVRGYIGTPLFGRTQVWTRME